MKVGDEGRERCERCDVVEPGWLAEVGDLTEGKGTWWEGAAAERRLRESLGVRVGVGVSEGVVVCPACDDSS